MPSIYFSEAERQRLASFPEVISEDELITFYTLTDSDLAAVGQLRGDANRLGFALQLGALRWLGFCPEHLAAAPPAATAYLAQQLGLSPAALADYGDRAQTRTGHLVAAQAHLGFGDCDAEALTALDQWLLERALEHDRPRLLFEQLVDKLYAERLVRPGVWRLERLIAQVRQQAGEVTHQRLADLLTPERRAWLDQLLVRDERLGLTRLEWLRRGATTNTPEAVLDTLAKLTYLREAGADRWDLSALNPNRRQLLARLGRKSTNQALQRAPEVRRYPTLVCFAHQAVEDLTDQAIELFDRYLAVAYSRSVREAKELRLAAARATSEQLGWFQRLIELVLDERIPDGELRGYIYRCLPRDRLAGAATECQRLARPPEADTFDRLVRRASTLGRFVPQLLAAFEFGSNRAAASLLAAVEVVRDLHRRRGRKVPEGTPLDFVPEKWLPYVLNEQGLIQRWPFELCVLWELRGALRGGNVWVAGSRRYANPASYLLPEAQWATLRPEVCQLIGAPEDGAQRFDQRQAELEARLARLDASLRGSGVVRMVDGELVVGRVASPPDPPSVVRLQDVVGTRLPRVELADLLVEIDRWTRFSEAFEHAGGSEPRSPELRTHLYAVLMAQACNLGLTTMADLAGLSYRALAWCQNWYVREETLQKAVDRLVDFHWSQPLSRLWGDGRLSSSDGQRFAMAVPNRLATALPRYFGYGRGLTFYTWSSDQYSQYGTKVIPATVRDATYVLDAILDNETALPIEEHTTDTAGYTEIVFALFDLLGLQFAPRLRDVGDQTLYRCDPRVRYQHLEPLLTGRIRRELILRHWDDLLRVAGSLKLGWVPASLLIGKLQAYPRQNAVTAVLAEYGRLIKTWYLAHYLENEAYRRRIHDQLRKGEQLHSLRRYLFFGHEGQLRQRQPEDQTTQAGCLNLVTNAVICWNTVYMSAVVEQLRREDSLVAEEDLVHLSPARSEHLNPYGRYDFDLTATYDAMQLRPLRPPRPA